MNQKIRWECKKQPQVRITITMMKAANPWTITKTVINDIPWTLVIHYFKGEVSLFRHYQNLFLEKHGPTVRGSITEIGCEKRYAHQRFFPNAESFVCTNIDRGFDVYLDITNNELEDNSVDNFLCASVLQHIFDIQRVFDEIARTLKPGGMLFLVAPFAYPVHDVVDYWRLSPDAYQKFLEGYEVIEFVHLGGTLSAVSDFLKRPRSRVTRRFFFYKLIGCFIMIFAKYFDRFDSLPLGVGVVARKSAVNDKRRANS